MKNPDIELAGIPDIVVKNFSQMLVGIELLGAQLTEHISHTRDASAISLVNSWEERDHPMTRQG